MRRAILLLAALAAAATCNVWGQGPEGSALLKACGATLRQADGGQLSEEDSIESIFCIGYVSGFLDGMSLTATLTGGRPNVCLPERGITNDQAIRILVKYLRENPETLHKSGRMSLYISLGKAFPCK